MRLTSPAGLSIEFNASGAPRRFDCGSISLALFIGNELEGGLANLYLRRLGERPSWVALLGPESPSRIRATSAANPGAGGLQAEGAWDDIDYSIGFALAQSAPAWFWHVRLTNRGTSAQQLDLSYAQDLALAPYGAVRLNEFYVSQYLDHTALEHAERGVVLASRQNQAADGRYPWSLIGSLRRGVSYATDALQFYGLASRFGEQPVGLGSDLPGRRLQHEHSMIVLRDAPLRLEPGQSVTAGFFGSLLADHPEATAASDLERVAVVLALPESTPAAPEGGSASLPAASTLFSAARLLDALELDEGRLHELFPGPWRHRESGDRAEPLSFFCGEERHVVLRAKELQVLRPHGHILRSGRHLTPDETALTSTVWMSGVFHSMLTQGHVSINRALSTVHSYLSLFRSHGLRLFAWNEEGWQLLQLPSAFEIAPDACRWIYRYAQGEIEVRSAAGPTASELELAIEVRAGAPLRLLCSLHVALNDDDGSTDGAARWRRDGNDILLQPAAGGDIGRRFPDGAFRLIPAADTRIETVGGDELLFPDGQSRAQPYVCLLLAPTRAAAFRIRGELIQSALPAPLLPPPGAALIPRLQLQAPGEGPLATGAARLAEFVPWLTHNALVHYLSPRGLEQYSGGGWGTRDVCQGPVEMLFALDRAAPVRDLLLRVMAMQNPDGDWPQWFMFFERERGIRAGDSHGDIVFWPLLVLGQYLLATGDAGLLQQPVRFFDPRGEAFGEPVPVWEHAQRALSLVQRRVIAGTALAAYGHGDWNDALQPADPHLRDHLCSAWTVTLHFQMLTTLARALRSIGRAPDALPLESAAQDVRRDFERLLLADGVLAGYALFDTGGGVRLLLHPSDEMTGVHYSALAMIHAILEDLLTPAQAREHVRLIEAHLSGPDGLRLFDRPMDYHGGPQRLFQRAESATFFGREIGLMYTHAHLRYAQALAHMGDAERFFRALCQANPIGVQSIVPSAMRRQSNCYYSSSDAAFADRYQASAEYERVARGTIALEGGWRVYSSGAGIALGLIARHFLGMDFQAKALRLDPVMPAALDGLHVESSLRGHPVSINYRVGARGCGVTAVVLNGRALPIEREPNPHRVGAALLPLDRLLEPLAGSANRLQIELG
jgi:cellobiose phosphorylase